MCRAAPRNRGGLVVAEVLFPSLVSDFEIDLDTRWGRGESGID